MTSWQYVDSHLNQQLSMTVPWDGQIDVKLPSQPLLWIFGMAFPYFCVQTEGNTNSYLKPPLSYTSVAYTVHCFALFTVVTCIKAACWNILPSPSFCLLARRRAPPSPSRCWGLGEGWLFTDAAQQSFGKGGPGNFLRIINLTPKPCGQRGNTFNS